MSEKIKDIIRTLDDGFDRDVVYGMIEKEFEEECKKEYSRGKLEEKKQHNQILEFWDTFWDNFQSLVWTVGGISLVLLFGYYIHNVNTKASQLDTNEMAACVAGEYKGCYEGWLRVDANGMFSMSNAERAYAYEEAFHRATGSYLLTEEDDRYYHGKRKR